MVLIDALFSVALASVASAAAVGSTTNLFTPTNYTVVPGLFIQDSPGFVAKGYSSIKDNLGIIDKSSKRWANVLRRLRILNQQADDLTAYKLVFIARHGEGFHNVAESTYGTPLWNCKWSLLNGDGNLVWGPDADLTSTGISQAQAARDAFQKEIAAGMPLPEKFYSSPLRRAASTLQITWLDSGLTTARPVIKEDLRESIGLHTCDLRRDKSALASDYPGMDFEVPFSEHDQLWDATYQESNGQQPLRLRRFMNQVFATDSSSVVSITCHSGVINSFFRAIGHQPGSVSTGGIVPVLIKAVGHPSATNTQIIGGPSATAPTCAAAKRSLAAAPTPTA